jgi:stress-induced morphogen
MIHHEDIKNLINQHLKDATVNVYDLTGTHNHLEVHVESMAFKGKTLIEQHKIIMNIMKKSLEGPLHAIKIKTSIPNA